MVTAGVFYSSEVNLFFIESPLFNNSEIELSKSKKLVRVRYKNENTWKSTRIYLGQINISIALVLKSLIENLHYYKILKKKNINKSLEEEIVCYYNSIGEPSIKDAAKYNPYLKFEKRDGKFWEDYFTCSYIKYPNFEEKSGITFFKSPDIIEIGTIDGSTLFTESEWDKNYYTIEFISKKSFYEEVKFYKTILSFKDQIINGITNNKIFI